MTASLISAFQRLARYNLLANERLYEACARVGEAERRKPRKAFFGSIHGTLNHILVGDRIWMARFSGGEPPPGGLDAILYEDFADLRAARQAEDRAIEAFAEALTEGWLSSEMDYANSFGRRLKDPHAVLLQHFFNHQTHHRGQVHDMLSQTGTEPPSLDMHRILSP